MSQRLPRFIFHVDLDAFYVSVEVRENPKLKGLPVVVGADPEGGKGRGVVMTSSYEARKFGLKSGMPISTAYRLCPQAVYLAPHWELYEDASRRVMRLLRGHADRFEQLGIEETEEDWRAALARRSAQPWYPAALAAVEKAEAGDESMEVRRAYMPFLYGRWDDAARAHVDVGVSESSRPVRDGFGAEGVFNPAKTREAISGLAAPVLVYAGELDAGPAPQTAAAGARLFPNATVTVQPGAAHFPWLDDPAFFTAAITSFLN